MSNLPPIPSTLPPIPQSLPPIPGSGQGLKYDPETVSEMWVKHGGDPKAAALMGHIAFSESGGDPNNINPKSGAAGLFQINPEAHGNGNWTDVDTNIKKAVELYNARKKQGQTGFEDWADSMNKGADGGWKKYFAQYVDSVTPKHITPTPHALQGGQNKPANMDPLRGNYNVIEQFAGHQDLPFMMANALLMDGSKPGLHTHEVMDYWTPTQLGGKGNPAAADAIYGLNSPQVLRAYQQSNVPWLKAYGDVVSQHPWMAGGLTFAAEFFNPMAWAEGGVVGRGIGTGVSMISKVPAFEKYMTMAQHLLSSYRGIVAEHGTAPRNTMAAIGQRMSQRDNKGHDAMMDIFGNTTAEEQHEIRRRQQGLEPVDFGDRNAELDKRAEKAQHYTRAMTAEKLATGALKKSQVNGVKGSAPTDVYHKGVKVGSFDYDPGTYVGLAGQYNHPIPEYNNLIQELTGATINGKPARVPSLQHKTYDNIDQAMQAKDHIGNQLISGDIDHAQIFRDFMSTGGKRVEFEQGMRELAQRHPDLITVPATKQDAQRLLSTGKYIPIKDVANSGIDLSGDKGSRFMQNAYISKSFRDFLTNKNSMSMVLGQSMAERGGGSKLEQWANGFNQLYRSMIVANPAYHPFWNVAPNASTAAEAGRTFSIPGHGLADAILNQTRAMLGAGATVAHTVGAVPFVGGLGRGVGRTLDAMREGLEYPFLKNAQSYQNALHTSLHAATQAASDEAGAAGAHAEFGGPRPVLGGDAGRVFTRDNRGKFTPKTSREFIDRMLTRADEWNKEGTFGERGERAFSTTLFHQLTGKGGVFEGDPYGAAWAVREALGHYRNINPENFASKLILFAPWLMGNVPFWFRALTKGPQLIDAGTEGSRMQRENAGDPSAYQSNYPKLGLSTYSPQTGNQDVALPFKDMEKVAQGFYDLTPDQVGPVNHLGGGKYMQGLDELSSEVTGRLKPGPALAANTAFTAKDQRANEPGSYQGYNVMFDKDLPSQIPTDWAKQAAATSLPLPFPFVSREIIQNGYDPQRMTAYIEEAAGLGYISDRQADSYKKLLAKPQAYAQREAVKLSRWKSGANPPSDDQEAAYKAEVTKNYARMMAQIQKVIAAQKQKAAGKLPPIPNASSLPPIPVGR